ncbi:MAG: biotin/lipoyl-binding protein [Chloroflexi bacterium]|nr:biotin/lipoyl-binding protein [Chloroflexota bacterium]
MEYRYRENETDYNVRLETNDDGTFSAYIGDRHYEIRLQRAQPGQLNLWIDGRRLHAYTASMKSDITGVLHHYIALVDREARHYELVTPTSTARSQRPGAASGTLKAQMPGQVMDVLVAEGDTVEQGQTLMILEAMKMEIRVTAPTAGQISSLNARKGHTVERGQQLATITPLPE